MVSNDTIAALSSGSGRAGVAVIRVSGSRAGQALQSLTGKSLPPARQAVVRRVLDPGGGEHLDTGLVIWFPGPESFTGEDCAEFHVHGGGAVVEGVLAALSSVPGVRPAEAGEFTRRAFGNGKLDLTAVEGLADLIEAETAEQRRQALRQYGGSLSERLDGWRQRLIGCLAYLEADIDFSDEDDVDVGGIAARLSEIQAIAAEIRGFLADGRRGERLRNGVHVAIIGPPNAGKSSVLNALAQRDAAIVSETAGTTRDVVEVHLDLGGVPFILADTAGLRAAEEIDPVEAEGMRRARSQAEEADLRILVVDGTGDAAMLGDPVFESAELILANKTDLSAWEHPSSGKGQKVLPVSARDGTGFEQVISALQALSGVEGAAALEGSVTRARHRAALERAAGALESVASGMAPELAAEELRVAARELGRVTGAVDVEDLLDVIFRDFCIGK